MFQFPAIHCTAGVQATQAGYPVHRLAILTVMADNHDISFFTADTMSCRSVFLGLAIVLCVSLQAQELPDKQRSLASRYAQLEQILFRLAETSATTHPRQTTLLNKALLESKDKLIIQRFATLVGELERRQFASAVTGQTDIEQDLLLLLKLLESVDRDESREREKEAIRELLKDLEEILQSERILKNQTHQQELHNLPLLEKEQRDIRMQAQALRDRLDEYEGTSPRRDNEPDESAEPQDGQQQDAQQQDGQQQDGQQQDGQQQDGQQQDGQQQDGQQQDGQQQEGQQQDAQQQDGQQQNQQQQEPTPTQRAMQRALERMRQAEERLQQAEREGAIEEQEEAIAELQRLKEELEKILRQLREEELLQTLERLEARFKRMLQQEQTIRAQTERLINELAGEQVPDQRQIKIRADRLANDQQSVIEDAEVALLILREDGTAQAMVESLLQARFDMVDVKTRLEQTSLDTITLHIEDVVIEALQEMLNAIQEAMDELRERMENAENERGEGEGAAMGEEPLIAILAELRMIRSMQRRVNDRTERYDNEIKQVLEKPGSDLGPFKRAVEELARQQNRISRILHELRIGRIR